MLLNDGERLDDLHRNGYKIIQNPDFFCFGVDAVLLSGYAKIKKGETVLDFCTGSGIIPVLLEAKTQGCLFTGVEIHGPTADMAKRSVGLNGLTDKITIINMDIRKMADHFQPSSFDVITANPPYIENAKGLVNQEDAKAIARHEIHLSLQDILEQARHLLRFQGRFYMVHKPHRLADILCTMRECAIEPKQITFVHPHKEKPPSMVLIEGAKGGGSFLKITRPLILYDENKAMSQDAYEIYYGSGQWKGE